jgi:glycosyltransferase involved in cell wall biosynthesis
MSRPEATVQVRPDPIGEDSAVPTPPQRPLPWISVVITTYDRWPLVAEAVASVLAQEVDGVEVVVVDDGSRDGTPTLLAERFPGITVLTGENVERGAARNRGAAHARGRYLAFLDSDDVYEPWHLAEVARAVSAGEPAVIAADAEAWDPGTSVRWSLASPRPGWPFREGALLGMVHPLQGLVVRRDEFDAVGGFPDERALAGSEDWVLLLRLSRRCEPVVLTRPGALVRSHAGRSMNDPTGIVRSRDAALAHVLADEALDLDDVERRLVRAGAHRFAAAHLYEAGRMGDARSRMRRVVGALGVRQGLPMVGRLWLQSLLGGRVTAVAREWRSRRAVSRV